MSGVLCSRAMGSELGIFRVILPVSDIDRAATFYARLLANDSGRRVSPYRHYFDCGAVILALVDPTPDGAAARANQEHLYIAVDDLEAVHARARELGCLSTVPVHGAPGGEIAVRPWRERSFYAEDPFGNPICFVARGSEFTGR
jgi:catechol 2,3-dioxygenase-like lactoylglutathione lyase family enzyme